LSRNTGEFQRGFAPLFIYLPLSFEEGEGDKGGEVDKNSNRVELINALHSSRISLREGRFSAK
jgi:hypothetical protein